MEQSVHGRGSSGWQPTINGQPEQIIALECPNDFGSIHEHPGGVEGALRTAVESRREELDTHGRQS
jgi:hypothetical protein